MTTAQQSHRFPWGVVIASAIALVILLALGTWQVERLQWKEALIASTEQRVHEAPLPLSEMEKIYKQEGSVEYRPVTVSGTFMHQGERHFLATYEGAAGYNVYTPLMLEDGRFVLVNRGFVPYEKKDPSTRVEGQVDGLVSVTGLARDPLPAKPGFSFQTTISPRIFSIGKTGRRWPKAPICQIWMRSCRSSSMQITNPIQVVCLSVA